jgi:uncharacterized membrane protein YheB (UPF0754 family)
MESTFQSHIEESKSQPLAEHAKPAVLTPLADPLDQLKQCDAVWQKTVPQFGIYSNEYQWATLLSALKCNASDKFFATQDNQIDGDLYAELYSNVRSNLPAKFMESIIRDDKQTNAIKINRYLLNSDITKILDQTKSSQPSVDFFVLNYSTAPFRRHFLEKLHMPKARINFAPHAYIY